MGLRNTGKFISNTQQRKARAPKRKQKNVGNLSRSSTIRIGSNPIHTFTRCAQVPLQIGTNGIVPAIGIVSSVNFSIWFTNQSAFIWLNASNYITTSVPGYAELAGLFDEVMVDNVEIEFYCTNLEALTGTGSAVMALCSDYNDHNAPANISDVLQYKDCKVVPLLAHQPYKEKVVPMMLGYTLDSAGVSQPSAPTKGFVRSNLDIEHNCRKGSFLTVPLTLQYYTVLFRYTYKCRTVK